MSLLLAYARWKFPLQTVDKQGHTQEEHFRSLERMTRKTRPELQGPEFPTDLQYVWEWFHQMSNGRTRSSFGWDRITWQDMAAWAMVTGIRLTGWECATIQELDTEWLKVLNANRDS